MSHGVRTEGCAFACRGYIYWLLWKSEARRGRRVGGEKPALWERVRAYRLRKWVSKRDSIFIGDCEGKFWQSQDPKPNLSKTETVVVWERYDLFLSDLSICLSLVRSPLSTPGQVPLGFCGLSWYWSSHGHFTCLPSWAIFLLPLHHSGQHGLSGSPVKSMNITLFMVANVTDS